MFLVLHTSSNRHALLCWLHSKAFVDDFIYKREPLSCSVFGLWRMSAFIRPALSHLQKASLQFTSYLDSVRIPLYILPQRSHPPFPDLLPYTLPLFSLIFLPLLSISSVSSGFSTVMPQLDLPLIAVTFFSLRGHILDLDSFHIDKNTRGHCLSFVTAFA